MNTFYRSLRAIPFRRGPSRWVGGICGGISAKFGWDPTLVRIVVLISFLLPVIGIGAYIVAWILLPWQDNTIPLERVFPGTQRPYNP
ncbi:PspC domain-containing protein [Citricoccus sp. GCM10030269]|uniref:PspC domain-containing protein n=1 Tax=Citricoccus sp. GCM10030269 TaxID=3273388 RepID=UPI0036151A6E